MTHMQLHTQLIGFGCTLYLQLILNRNMLFFRCLLMVANFDLLFYTHNSFQFERETDFFKLR